jgi:hypothetical protein
MEVVLEMYGGHHLMTLRTVKAPEFLFPPDSSWGFEECAHIFQKGQCRDIPSHPSGNSR